MVINLDFKPLEELNTNEDYLQEAKRIIEDLTYRIYPINKGEINDISDKKYVGNTTVYAHLDRVRHCLRMAEIKGEALNITIIKG